VWPIKVDIIGAGLGGLSTAISIKTYNPNIEVIVHEKYKDIGYNHEGRRCGEAHSVEREWKQWVPTGKSIYNTILRAEVTVGKHHYITTRPPGVAFILNRQEFICQLACDAEKKGVILQTNDKIQSIKDLTGDDTIQIIFSRDGGYFWIFPRNPEKNEVNIGVGVFGDFGYDLREMLQGFKEDQHITGTMNYVTGGLIPLGLQRPFLYRNILFVGDAGVGAFPFSGQGIYRALMSGDIAGRCIAQDCIKKYPSIIRKEFTQWDVMGFLFIKTNLVFRKINPVLFYHSLNFFFRGGNEFELLSHW
jgi:flavin-dependent dehydrogenase